MFPIPKEVADFDADAELPKEIHELLEEFKDVMPEQLPKKLPPKRSIDHRIEIFKGNDPSAKAPYRLSQDENQELKKQLNELLKAGSNPLNHHTAHQLYL